MHQVLPPGVQDGQEADPGPQVLGIPADGEKGVGGGPEQDPVDRAAVLESERPISSGTVKTMWKYGTSRRS